jgi:hypothetical protein
MKIYEWLVFIFVIAALIFCYWKFDASKVTISVLAATGLINLYKTAKRRNGK